MWIASNATLPFTRAMIRPGVVFINTFWERYEGYITSEVLSLPRLVQYGDLYPMEMVDVHTRGNSGGVKQRIQVESLLR